MALLRVRRAALAALALACADTAPVPASVVHESARFVLVDYAATPVATVEALLARLEQDYDRVGELLPEFVPPRLPINVVIEAGYGIPFVTPGANRMTHWGEAIRPDYVTHQLTHLYTGYRRSNFIEEGLAVWVSEQLRPEGEAPDPFRAQPPHAWVALFRQHASLIPLEVALTASNLGHAYDGSSPDASAWQLFNQAGSFTRWVLETHGRDAWIDFYLSGNVTGSLGMPLDALEAAWLDHASAAHPAPLACEEALAPVGSREAFWCARARGE